MSFYRNFKSKDDLVEKSLEKSLENLKDTLSKQEQINQYTVTREIFATALKYQKITQAFKNTEYIDKFTNYIAEKLFTFLYSLFGVTQFVSADGRYAGGNSPSSVSGKVSFGNFDAHIKILIALV